MKGYKSPWAALVWFFALPGFGQLYNRDYFIAVILIVLEFGVNLFSHLNLSILHTFHGQLDHAHHVVNYEHGLFYPSVWGFSMWQAYNSAKKWNEDGHKRVYLTGLFFGLIAGMNFGLFTHDFFLSPVYGGLFTGFLGAFAGHVIEILITRIQKIKINTDFFTIKIVI